MHSDLEPEAKLARALRELPEEAARPYSFADFERRALPRNRASRSRAGGQLLAAIVVIALAVVAVTVRLDRPAPPLHAQAVVEVREPGTPSTPATAAPAVRADVMERWLASLPM